MARRPHLDVPAAGAESSAPRSSDSTTRQKFRKKLLEGELDARSREREFSNPGVDGIFARRHGGLTSQIQGMFQNLGQGRRRQRKLKIREAMKLLTEEEAAKLVNDEDLKAQALSNVEQNGIVFLDEMDKITSRAESHGAEVSRQGVQRDLLPLVEGTTVSTKHGMIKTDHILFIASGAFHLSKPSELIPESRGAFRSARALEPVGRRFREILTKSACSCAVRGATRQPRT